MAYTRCLRCNRSLRDPTSKRRGYGPECWNKVKHALPPSGAPMTERRSISNIFTASHVTDQLKARISSLSCPFCGASLASASLHSYDHAEGLHLQGFFSPQWVFFTCPTCKLDSSLHRLTRDHCGDLCKHSVQQTLAELFSL